MLPAATIGVCVLLAQTAAQSTPPQSRTPPPQTSTQAQAPPAVSAESLPSDIAKIRDGLSKKPTGLLLEDKSPFRFYTTTVAPAPKFSDIVGDFDLHNGQVPHSGMTHADFLRQTRPRDMYSSAGFSVGDVIRWALLGYGERKAYELVRLGIKEMAEAKTEAEKKAIQARIERELAALRGEVIK